MLFIILVKKRGKYYDSLATESPYIQKQRKSLYLLGRHRPWWTSEGSHCSRAGRLLQLLHLHQLAACLECSSKSCELETKGIKSNQVTWDTMYQGQLFQSVVTIIYVTQVIYFQNICLHNILSFHSFLSCLSETLTYLFSCIPSIHWVYYLVGY